MSERHSRRCHEFDGNLWLVAGRVFMLGAGSLFAVFGSQMVDYSGAGPLASIVAAFVACCGWKLEGWTSSFSHSPRTIHPNPYRSGSILTMYLRVSSVILQNKTVEHKFHSIFLLQNPVEDTFSTFWKVFQPILFGLIGTEIDFNRLDSQTIALGLGVLFVGLTVRVLVCFLVTLGGTLNFKERFFVTIAWFPKATVQAALGPVALDIARKQSMSDEIQTLASQVLTISVLSILVTAPLGAMAISLTGPRLLNKGASPSALMK
uniref:Cation/H+ exchanger transmembrane domain-containing protein n=1 Tax=Timema douglasi TaxID=61478 RepID=A0A7R8VAH5_TIMDO|nr:unnamed protein product [Timema douglasi]